MIGICTRNPFFLQEGYMDIVKVLMQSVKSNMDERGFEISAIIDNPTQENALDRLSEHVKQYALLRSQLEILNSLSNQIDKTQNENEN
jgi:hypothetical protein